MVSQNFDFLMNKNLDKYAGDWIAVSGNKIIANGNSASEVMSKSRKTAKRKATIMRVPSKNQVLLL